MPPRSEGSTPHAPIADRLVVEAFGRRPQRDADGVTCVVAGTLDPVWQPPPRKDSLQSVAICPRVLVVPDDAVEVVGVRGEDWPSRSEARGQQLAAGVGERHSKGGASGDHNRPHRHVVAKEGRPTPARGLRSEACEDTIVGLQVDPLAKLSEAMVDHNQIQLNYCVSSPLQNKKLRISYYARERLFHDQRAS